MDATPTDDQRALIRALTAVLRDLARLAPEESRPSPLAAAVSEHLGRPAADLPMVIEAVVAHRIVDADLALELLADDGQLIGVRANGMRDHSSFAAMLASEEARFDPGPVDWALVASGPRTKRRVVAFGIRLFHFEGEPVAVLQRTANRQVGRESAVLEILAADPGRTERLVGRLRTLMRERSVLRGQVLSFDGGDFDDGSAGATFHEREAIADDAVVLAPGVLEAVRRHVIGIGERRDALRAAGQHLKRGVLLYGPPGTGKTLTVRHLVGAATGATVVLLAGRSVRFVSEATELARTLQPAVVVLEDIDLIANDRGRMGPQPLLFAVLDALDGLGGDADVAFLMTTNRVADLERALSQRPGRVDLAVEVPLPCADERRRLFSLYGAGLGLSDEVLDAQSLRAEGTTASFAKELMRRTVLLAADGGRPVEDGDLVSALDELLSDRATLTRSLLGSGAPTGEDPDPGAEAVVTGGFRPMHSRLRTGWTSF